MIAKVVWASDTIQYLVGELWPPLLGADHAVLVNAFPRARLDCVQGREGHNGALYLSKSVVALELTP